MSCEEKPSSSVATTTARTACPWVRPRPVNVVFSVVAVLPVTSMAMGAATRAKVLASTSSTSYTLTPSPSVKAPHDTATESVLACTSGAEATTPLDSWSKRAMMRAGVPPSCTAESGPGTGACWSTVNRGHEPCTVAPTGEVAVMVMNTVEPLTSTSIATVGASRSSDPTVSAAPTSVLRISCSPSSEVPTLTR